MALNDFNENDHPRSASGKFAVKEQSEPARVALAPQPASEHPDWNTLANELTEGGMNTDQAVTTVGGMAIVGFAKELVEAGQQARQRGNQTVAAMVFIAVGPVKNAAAALAADNATINGAREAIRRADRELASSDNLLGMVYPSGESVFATSRKALAEVSRFLDEHQTEETR